MTASTKTARASKSVSPSPRVKRVTKRTAPSAPPIEALEADVPQPAEPAPVPSLPRPPAGKLGIVVDLLRRPEGATLAQISTATAWQPHSVRGAMAGALKKKHGLSIISEPAEGGRVYRLAAANAS